MKVLPANYLDVLQGSSEWFQARLGCVTSSRVAGAMSYLKRKSANGEKGDESKARFDLKLQLLCERLTGAVSPNYVSVWMENGKENEPLARTAYELKTGSSVEIVGLALHPTIKYAAASPDGLVGQDGLVEFKVPKPETHLRYRLNGTIPEEYQAQMLWQLACDPERKWNDFVSHVPELPEWMNTFIVRMERPNNLIAAMEAEVIKFLGEVDDMMTKLHEHYGGPSLIEKKLKESLGERGLYIEEETI